MGNRSSPSLRVRGGNEREKASPVFLVAEGEAVRRRRRGSFGIPLSNRLPTYLHLPYRSGRDRSGNKDCVSYSIKFTITWSVRPSVSRFAVGTALFRQVGQTNNERVREV